LNNLDVLVQYDSTSYSSHVVLRDLNSDGEHLKNRYFAKGLKAKVYLSDAEIKLFNNPNRYYDCVDELDHKLAPEIFVNKLIPLGHRLDYGKEIKDHVYGAVKNLLFNKPVKILQKPLVTNNYIDTDLQAFVSDSNIF